MGRPRIRLQEENYVHRHGRICCFKAKDSQRLGRCALYTFSISVADYLDFDPAHLHTGITESDPQHSPDRLGRTPTFAWSYQTQPYTNHPTRPILNNRWSRGVEATLVCLSGGV